MGPVRWQYFAMAALVLHAFQGLAFPAQTGLRTAFAVCLFAGILTFAERYSGGDRWQLGFLRLFSAAGLVLLLVAVQWLGMRSGS